MSKEELWAIYVAKNPPFATSKEVVIKTESLKKLFDQTWETAHAKGVENGKALAAMQAKPSLFEKIFGK